MYIARQPIFNRDLKVYAYELLYRSSSEDTYFENVSGTIATATLLGALLELGLKQIVSDKKAFINFDEEILLSETPFLLPMDNVVIEILETVKPDVEIISRLKKLSERGYWLALDDFDEDYDTFPFVKCANIIKFDVRQKPLSEIKDSVEKALNDNKIILAEKVETQEEFELAKEMGFHLFQGFFFSKPKIVGSSSNTSPNSISYAILFNELYKEEPSFQKLAELFEVNINTAYKVLRLGGDRNFGGDINFIKKSLQDIGLRDLKRWVSVVMVSDAGADKPMELFRLSLIRAKFAELLTRRRIFNNNIQEAFLLGLFSLLDAMFDKPMKKVVTGLPLSDDAKNCLKKLDSNYNPLYQFIIEYENGEIDMDYLKQKFSEEQIKQQTDCYLEAVKWQSAVFETFEDV